MNLYAWLLWLVPLAAAPLVPLIGRATERACRWFAVGVTGVTATVGVALALTFSAPTVEGPTWVPLLRVPLQVQVDGLSAMLGAFVALLSFVIVVYAAGNMSRERGQARFYSLVLLFVGGMLGLVMSGNLIQLYVFWEIVGICSAFLIAFWNERETARRAGIKAFLVTRVGDAALLLAVLLILTSIGTTSLTGVAAAASNPGAANWRLIALLVVIGAAGKSAQFPFHVWLPDAMEGPTPVSALIHAATMVNAGVYLLVRLDSVIAASQLAVWTVLGMGLVSMVLGAACACAAEDLKRVLAYSTISQLGLMFAAIGVGSLQGAVFHLISQGVFKALAFMAAGSVIEAVGTRNMGGMGGLRVMKYTYLAFMAAVLAMTGLPPLIGFWTKDAIMSASLQVGAGTFLVIALGSVLTAYYSFRALFRVFHGPRREGVSESGRLMTWPMLSLVAAAVFGWLALDYQRLVPPAAVGVEAVPLAASLAALGAGAGLSYFAFVARRDAVGRVVLAHGSLGALKEALLSGVWFDSAYDSLANFVSSSLSKAALLIQTGDMTANAALVLSALLAVVLAIALGVI